VLAAALQVARDSGGAFDPSAGPLVDLWGFGAPRHHGDAGFCVPHADETEQARARTGWQRLLLDVPARRVRQPGGMAIDLSAIAKGFAVDKLAHLLTARGLANHLVEVGGELRGAGGKPDGQPWWVALESPPGHAGEAGVTETIVALHGLAVATSGDYRRCFTHGGERLCHSIDPRSGRPIAHGLASVTVLHGECMLADAQSTALTVLGLEHGLAHAQQHRIAALFVQRTGDGVEEHMSDAFAALL
jgi:thiamine biosynthesis lipoprotein